MVGSEITSTNDGVTVTKSLQVETGTGVTDSNYVISSLRLDISWKHIFIYMFPQGMTKHYRIQRV